MIWLVGAVAFVVAIIVTGLIRRYALRVLLDQPNERSSHSAPTPRGGGVGLVVGVMIGAGCGLALGWVSMVPMVWWLIVVAAMSGLGWWDDHANLPARLRLVMQFLIVGLVVVVVGMPATVGFGPWSVPMSVWIWWPVAVVGGVWLVNLTNFMDGIDGIAGTQGVVGCMGLLLLVFGGAALGGQAALLLMATIGACAGFLLWNRPPALIFMGDVGSTALGLIFTVGVLVALRLQMSVDVVLLPLMPFIADATCTLFRRAWRRERLSQAHRSHLYQRLARHWGSHGLVTGLYGLLAVVGVGLSMLTIHQIIPGGVGILMWCVCFALLAWYGHRAIPATSPVQPTMLSLAPDSQRPPSSASALGSRS